MSYPVTILNREVIARDTVALRLSKPDGFTFEAGQNIDVTVADPEYADPNDNARIFSIASAPHEDHILIAARLRDNPYKKALNTLPAGGRLYIDGPFGTFRLHEDVSIPAVFIAGGIGITPCLSILRRAAYQGDSRQFYLFYSNRTFEDTTYLDELTSLTGKLSRFTLIPTMTRDSNNSNGSTFERGRVTGEMIGRYIGEPRLPRYYIVGHSQMVWGMVQSLDGYIDRDRILVEDFTGF